MMHADSDNESAGRSAVDVLIVDDDPKMRQLLTTFVDTLGYSFSSCSSGEAAIEACQHSSPRLVLLDIKMPGLDGIEVLERLKSIDPSIDIAMISGHDDVQTVVRAMQRGAVSFLTKPVPVGELRLLLEKILVPHSAGAGPRTIDGLVGSSPPMEEVSRMVHRMAETSATVLIRGDSGTGKQLVARAIHDLGGAREAPFVTVDCTNIPASLMESELFGHERGAYTDAKSQKVGLFEKADGGTVFLDELGLMPMALQAKLLNVLETQCFRRVGGTTEIQVSVRLIAATNEDLEDAVQQGRFREDLYYRLNVVPIYMPALRERGDDILQLAEHFLHLFVAEHGTGKKHLTRDAKALLRGYNWPGNVRELRNIMERAVLMIDEDGIGATDLVIDRRARRRDGGANNILVLTDHDELEISFPHEGISLEELENKIVKAALRYTDGNVSQAARLLHVSRDIVRYRVKKFDLAT